MADSIVVSGIFQEIEPTATALDELRALGISDRDVTLLSSIPYPEEVFGRPKIKVRLPIVTLIGAIAGALAGIFLAVITPHLYVIRVGGQQIVPPPPTAVLLYELTMMGLVVGTVLGFIWLNLFPAYGREYYDRTVSDSGIGLFIHCSPAQTERVRSILATQGAQNIQEPERRPL
jgi:hypothetical protein